MKPNYQIMQNFNLKNIPNLDICVLGALEMLSDLKLPKIPKVKKNEKIIVLGSGNALATGRIIFSEYDSVFANESNYKKKLRSASFDKAFIISASGSKHAPIIAKTLKRKKIPSILLTNNSDAKAKKFVSESLVFPKQREPYTYNTSTYLSMIISKTRESPNKIYHYLKKIKKKIPRNLKKYNSVYIITPAKFEKVNEFFETKFDELFGPKIASDIFTIEQTKHAKTITEDKKELFIGFDYKNNLFGMKNNRLNIKLPRNAGPGFAIAVGYYIIGKIQEQNKSYFKKNIVNYTKKASRIFKEEIKPIVD